MRDRKFSPLDMDMYEYMLQRIKYFTNKINHAENTGNYNNYEEFLKLRDNDATSIERMFEKYPEYADMMGKDLHDAYHGGKIKSPFTGERYSKIDVARDIFQGDLNSFIEKRKPKHHKSKVKRCKCK